MASQAAPREKDLPSTAQPTYPLAPAVDQPSPAQRTAPHTFCRVNRRWRVPHETLPRRTECIGTSSAKQGMAEVVAEYRHEVVAFTALLQQ